MVAKTTFPWVGHVGTGPGLFSTFLKQLLETTTVGAPKRLHWQLAGGGVCPARFFCINYPNFKPGFTLPHIPLRCMRLKIKNSWCASVCWNVQSISPTRKGPVHIPNWKGASPFPHRKGASPYPQPERGLSVSPTGKGLVHTPN